MQARGLAHAVRVQARLVGVALAAGPPAPALHAPNHLAPQQRQLVLSHLGGGASLPSSHTCTEGWSLSEKNPAPCGPGIGLTRDAQNKYPAALETRVSQETELLRQNRSIKGAHHKLRTTTGVPEHPQDDLDLVPKTEARVDARLIPHLKGADNRMRSC